MLWNSHIENEICGKGYGYDIQLLPPNKTGTEAATVIPVPSSLSCQTTASHLGIGTAKEDTALAIRTLGLVKKDQYYIIEMSQPHKVIGM